MLHDVLQPDQRRFRQPVSQVPSRLRLQKGDQVVSVLIHVFATVVSAVPPRAALGGRDMAGRRRPAPAIIQPIPRTSQQPGAGGAETDAVAVGVLTV